MNRQQFLTASGCCAALAILKSAGGNSPAPAAPETVTSVEPPLTPAVQRVAFAETWAKRFFDAFDANADAETREKVMRANGRACHLGSLDQNPSPGPTVDEFIALVQKYDGSEAIRREGDVIYFSYVKNPRGLKVADGYCLCPLVESGPKGLSPTYCLCSVGYVQHMFEGMTGHAVKVELLASLKRGDTSCRFKISLS